MAGNGDRGCGRMRATIPPSALSLNADLAPPVFRFDIFAFHHKTVSSSNFPYDGAIAHELACRNYGGAHRIKMDGHHPKKIGHFSGLQRDVGREYRIRHNTSSLSGGNQEHIL